MSSAPRQPPPRPTLEELLRFKRAERPSPEFWAEFDRGLRQKQLAALMQRPQGWDRIRPYFLRGVRWAVPATAAAAVALVVLQISTGPGSAPAQAPVIAVASPLPEPVSGVPVQLAFAQTAPAIPQVHAVDPQDRDEKAETVVAPVVAQAEPASSAPVETAAVRLEPTLPWSATTLAYNDSAHYRATDLYPVRLASREPRRTNSSWTSRFTEMVRDLSAKQSESRVLQLASLSLPGGNQYAAAASTSGQLLASNDRSGRTLSDREFRDLDSRFGVKGTSLSIKF